MVEGGIIKDNDNILIIIMIITKVHADDGKNAYEKNIVEI